MRENRMDENVTIVYAAYITLRILRCVTDIVCMRSSTAKRRLSFTFVTANTANASDSCVI